MIPGAASQLLLSDAGSPSVAFQGSASGSGSSLTYTSAPLGTEFPNRKILVALAIDRTCTVTSVTVAGVAARQIASTLDTANSGHCVWVADVPTGTTGTIVANFNVTSRQAMAVYSATDFENEIPYSNVYGTGTVSLNAPSGGFAIGMSNKGNLSSSTWTNLTMDIGIYQGSQSWVSVASGAFPAGASALSVTASGTPSITVFAFGNN